MECVLLHLLMSCWMNKCISITWLNLILNMLNSEQHVDWVEFKGGMKPARNLCHWKQSCQENDLAFTVAHVEMVDLTCCLPCFSQGVDMAGRTPHSAVFTCTQLHSFKVEGMLQASSRHPLIGWNPKFGKEQSNDSTNHIQEKDV